MTDLKKDLEKMLTLLTAGLPPMAEAMAEEDGNLDAEVLGNYFALGMAVVIENDPSLTNPRAMRLASETAGQKVLEYMRYFRLTREHYGAGFLEKVLERPMVN